MVVFAAPQLREYEELRNDPSSFEGRARTDEAVVDTSGVPGADVERGRLCGLCPLEKVRVHHSKVAEKTTEWTKEDVRSSDRR